MFLGQYVAGDEKLFYFTGDSIIIRQVISKPDKIGLWFYELCCKGQKWRARITISDALIPS